MRRLARLIYQTNHRSSSGIIQTIILSDITTTFTQVMHAGTGIRERPESSYVNAFIAGKNIYG